MADIIRLLPDNLANQIAAGEVVQRPASVVKELLENAIDAGAQNIRLIVKDAGKTLIQVVDDGIGMTETDARLCFERHATSKIRATEDLFNIRTMGFRGEALASVAAVAQVELRSKQRSQELGTRIVIEGSEIILQEPCQATAGTSIMVKNLFFNVPARRNFLKSNNIEMRHIMDEFQQIAMAHPDIFFSLHHNGTKLFHLPAGNLRQRIVGLLGTKTNAALIPIEEETDIIKIHGYIGKPDHAKKIRGEQFFFVNNRFIKSNYLQHALFQAYEDLLPQKMYPLYCVFFDIDPSKIDVNVHPTKQEIKFEDERLVYNYLRVTCRHALARHSITPTLDFESDDNGLMQHFQNDNSLNYIEVENLTEDKNEPIHEEESEGEIINSKISGNKGFSSKSGSGNGGKWPAKNPLYESNLKNWEKLYEGLLHTDNNEEKVSGEHQGEISFESRISGDNAFTENIGNPTEESAGKALFQLHNIYVVSPIKSGFLLIDQNAAHQRVLYEKYLKQLQSQEPVTQYQLFPQTIHLSPNDSELLMDILPELNTLGIDIKEFGQNSFVVHGLPTELKEVNEQNLIEELLEQYQLGQSLKLDVHHNLARSLAKQSAIKAGRVLTSAEMQRLVDKLFGCEVPYQAPNGRKTFITVDLSELSRRFE